MNAAGRNNTRFVSGLAPTNPGDSVYVLLTFVPGGSLEDQEVSLSTGQTVVFRNVLQELWGGPEVSGAVQIPSEVPLLIRADLQHLPDRDVRRGPSGAPDVPP